MLAIRPFGMQGTATRLEYSIRVRRSEDERGRLRCMYPGRMIVSESGVCPHARRGRALTVAASRGVGAGSARQSHGRRARIPPAARCYEGDCARARFRQRRSESPCGRREVRRTDRDVGAGWSCIATVKVCLILESDEKMDRHGGSAPLHTRGSMSSSRREKVPRDILYGNTPAPEWRATH